MRTLAQDAFCFVTVITLLGSVCGYAFLDRNNLEDLIDNDRRKDFSTLDELPLSKFDYFMPANLNAENSQADNSLFNGKRQMIKDYKMLSKRLTCIPYGCKIPF